MIDIDDRMVASATMNSFCPRQKARTAAVIKTEGIEAQQNLVFVTRMRRAAQLPPVIEVTAASRLTFSTAIHDATVNLLSPSSQSLQLRAPQSSHWKSSMVPSSEDDMMRTSCSLPPHEHGLLLRLGCEFDLSAACNMSSPNLPG
jgi:hypothetical protein